MLLQNPLQALAEPFAAPSGIGGAVGVKEQQIARFQLHRLGGVIGVLDHPGQRPCRAELLGAAAADVHSSAGSCPALV